MGDESRNMGTCEPQDRQILRDFIVENKQLPELWNVRSKEYLPILNVIKKKCFL